MNLVLILALKITNYYDTTIKHFQDGTIQYRANLIILPDKDFSLSPGIDNKKDSDPVRSAQVSYSRTVANLYDIVHANVWEWFFTLTLNPDKVDRMDYYASFDAIRHYADSLRKFGCLYVIVPEHHKNGAWHFHGLINNVPDHLITVNDNGYFDFRTYDAGYCSLSRVIDSAKAANYILKYMLKGYQYLDIPKGKKRYFASRKLQRPVVIKDVLTSQEVDELIAKSFWHKRIDNDFYDGYIIDIKEST